MSDEERMLAFKAWCNQMGIAPGGIVYEVGKEAWRKGAAQQREIDALIADDPVGVWNLQLLGQYDVLSAGIHVTVDTSPIADAIRKDGEA